MLVKQTIYQQLCHLQYPQPASRTVVCSWPWPLASLRRRKLTDNSPTGNILYYNVHTVYCVFQRARRYGGGGGHEPGGLEGEVYSPRSSAHEVQGADHQDSRTHRWQGKSVIGIIHHHGDSCLQSEVSCQQFYRHRFYLMEVCGWDTFWTAVLWVTTGTAQLSGGTIYSSHNIYPWYALLGRAFNDTSVYKSYIFLVQA